MLNSAGTAGGSGSGDGTHGILLGAGDGGSDVGGTGSSMTSSGHKSRGAKYGLHVQFSTAKPQTTLLTDLGYSETKV